MFDIKNPSALAYLSIHVLQRSEVQQMLELRSLVGILGIE